MENLYFKYKAILGNNIKKSGIIKAENKNNAADKLKIKYNDLISFKMTQIFFFRLRVKDTEIILFTKRLQVMLASGISLIRALSILSESKNEYLSFIINSVIDDIASGTELSKALSKFPKQFDSTYTSLISIGESSGTINSILLDIAKKKERANKISRKMKNISIYPVILLITVICVMMFASFFFIPTFKNIFKGTDYEFPLITQIVFKIANMLPLIAAVILIFTIIVKLIIKFPKPYQLYRKIKDSIVLKIPFTKKIIIQSYMYKFSSMLSLMLKNGINLKKALDLVKNSIDNIYIQNEIQDISDMIMRGESLSKAIFKQKHFDDVLNGAVITGEESGELEKSLMEISEFYDLEISDDIDKFSEIIQPLSILIMAIIIAPVIFAVYLPIFDLSSGAFME